MYTIKEIYKTIQGEGAQAGRTAYLLGLQAAIFGLAKKSIGQVLCVNFVIQIL